MLCFAIIIFFEAYDAIVLSDFLFYLSLAMAQN